MEQGYNLLSTSQTTVVNVIHGTYQTEAGYIE